MTEIRFYGHKNPHGFLSNFYDSPFELEGEDWSTVEHFYQAAKATSLIDRQIVATAPDPGTAKHHGRAIKCREDWEDVVGSVELRDLFLDERGYVVELVKDHYMYAALVAKFEQNPILKKALLDTGDATLIENSPSDAYWGCGKSGTGLNKLGRMLMLIRAAIRDHAR